jgi:TonB family protein
VLPLPISLDSLASARPYPALPHEATCAACEHTYRVSLLHGGCFLPPQIIGGYRGMVGAAKYPEPAPEGEPEGRPIVRFFVRADGSAEDLEIVHAVHPALDRAAAEVVRRTAFRPAYSPCLGSIGERYAVAIPFRRAG